MLASSRRKVLSALSLRLRRQRSRQTAKKGPGVGLTFCGGHNTKRNPLDKFSYLCRPDDDIIFNTTTEICMFVCVRVARKCACVIYAVIFLYI